MRHRRSLNKTTATPAFRIKLIWFEETTASVSFAKSVAQQR